MIDPRPLRGAPIAVIDFETTGPNPATCKPVAVAVVVVDALGDSEPRLAYNSLVNPGVPIPAEATAIHGITDADVVGAPNPRRACGRVLHEVGSRVLASYNLPYEWFVLCDNVHMPPEFMGLDPLVWAKEVDKYKSGKKLSDVCARRGIEIDAHKAESDAMATAHLMKGLLRQLVRGAPGRFGWDGPWCTVADMRTVGDFWRWQAATATRQEAEYAEYRAKNGQEPPTRMWSVCLEPMGTA